MKKWIIDIIIILLLGISLMKAQEPNYYSVYNIAFYNVENLFDTINDPSTFDDSMTPTGSHHWDSRKYNLKIVNLAEVISGIGREVSNKPPDIIGLCEVENYEVLKDLRASPKIQNLGYEIIHEDSPDKRGIDVALLYRPAIFNPTSFKSHRLLLFDESNHRVFTRDQLLVGGFIENEEIFFIVNHWPSRRGGETKSKSLRKLAARLNRRVIDSVSRINPSAKIISMGDFNDNPTDSSIKNNLTYKTDSLFEVTSFFNPMEVLYRKGLGSLAYRDEWSLFDQFLCSENLKKPSANLLYFWKAGIYKPPYLVTRHGAFKGYPKRTHAAGIYSGGYSDHFPVYLLLLKKEN